MVLIYTNSSDVDTAAIHGILDTQPEEYSEDEFIDINNESGCNKNKDVLGSDIRKHWDKECSDIFCNIESTRDKMIEA